MSNYFILIIIIGDYNKISIHRQEITLHNSRLFLILSGFIISIGMLVFLVYSRSTELEIGKINQLAHIELVNRKLDQFVTTSDLLSRFIQEDISGKKLTKNIIEEKLAQYLRASPSDIIFGVGIWYGPFKFSKHQKFFGPYIHRNNKHLEEKLQLTYEWNTPEYNYHSQTWYKEGLKNPNKSFYVAPYFDNGLVYVTNSRGFYDSEKNLNGVISIDLVLPQLQKIITLASSSKTEIIYIADSKGNLLAHPLKDDFLNIEKTKNTDDSQNLLKYTVKDLNSALQINQDNWIESKIVHEQLGWKVVVITSQDKLLPNYQHLKNFLMIAFTGLWLIVLAAWQVISYYSKQQQLNRKQVEASRLQLIQSSKMAALGMMASGMAHEINNPLAIIVGKINIILRRFEKQNTEDEELKKSLGQVLLMASRIQKAIDGLRTFSKSGVQDSPEEVFLETIINETVNLCTERFINNNIKLEICEIPSVKITCRKSQISQAILNLLSNSFDATIELDEKWVKIQSLYDSKKHEVSIEIIDSGKKLSPDLVKHIFDPFYTTKDIGKGAGLGLSISKGIIEEHKGTLEYDTTSSNTKFIVTFKLPY
jgi:signal transduction histidine kinase